MDPVRWNGVPKASCCN